MRIGLVHSFYSSRQPSGENLVVMAQLEALRGAGHTVQLFERRTDDVENQSLYAQRSAFGVATGIGSDPSAPLHRFEPDIVHVHNLFPNFGTRWLTRWEGPMVATLHNFRTVCAAGTLFRDGEHCRLCLDHSSAESIRHRCYRDSILATLPLAIATRRGPRHALLRRADALVCLSARARGIFESAGVRSDRLHTIPNFSIPVDLPNGVRSDRWLYVGRLSPEKGIVRLLEGWPADVPLTVVGDGPSAPEVRRLAHNEVRFIGELDHASVRALMSNSRGLVFPSLWAEGLPTVYLEALAAGLPVLAFSGSSVADLVIEQKTGLTVDWGSSLEEALSDSVKTFEGLSEHCRSMFDLHYSAELWVKRMTAVYRSLS